MMPYCEIIDISDDSDNDCEFLGETQGEIDVIQIVAEKKGNRVATHMSNKSDGDIVLEEVITPIDDKQSSAKQLTSSAQENTEEHEHVEEVPIQDIPQLKISVVPLSTEHFEEDIIEIENQPQVEKISTNVEPQIETVGASIRKRKATVEVDRSFHCQEKKYRIMPPKLPKARVRNAKHVEGSTASQMARTMMQPKSKIIKTNDKIQIEVDNHEGSHGDELHASKDDDQNLNMNIAQHQLENVGYIQTPILAYAIEPQLEPNQTTQSIQLNELNAETVNGPSGEPYEQPEVPINMPKQAPVLLVHTNEEFQLDQQDEDVLEIALTDNTGSLYHVNVCLEPNNHEIIAETDTNEQHVSDVRSEEFNIGIDDTASTETALSDNIDMNNDFRKKEDHGNVAIDQHVESDQEEIVVLENDSEAHTNSHVPHYDFFEEIVTSQNNDETEELLNEETENQDQMDSEPEEICNTTMPVLRLRRQSSEDSEYLPPKKSSKRKAACKTRNMRQEEKSNQEPERAKRGRKRQRIADDDEVQQNVEIIEKAHCIDQLKHNNRTSENNNGSQEASSQPATEIEEISTETSNGDNYPELEMTRPKTKPPVLSRASSEQPPGSPSSPPNSSPPPKKTKKDNKRGDASTSRCEDQLSQLSLSDKESDGNDCPPLRVWHEGRKVPVQKEVPEDPDNVREHIAYLLDRANQGNTRKPSDAKLLTTMSGINSLFKPACEGAPDNADSIGVVDHFHNDQDARQPSASAGTTNATKMLCSGKPQQQKQPSSSKPASSQININLQPKAQIGNQEFEELPEHLRSKIPAFSMKGMFEGHKRKSTDPAKAERDAKLKAEKEAEKEAKKIEKEAKKKAEKETKQAEKEAKKKRKSSLKPSEIVILNDVLPTRAHSHISSPLFYNPISRSPEQDENIDPMAAMLEPAHWSMPLRGNVRRMADQLNAGRIPYPESSPFPQVLSDPLQTGSVQEILNRFSFMFLSPHVYPFKPDLVSHFDLPPWDNQQSDCALHLLETSLKELQNTTTWHMWMIEKVKQDRMTEERSRYAMALKKVNAASSSHPTVQPTVPATSVPSTSGLTTAPLPPPTSSARTVQQTHPTVIRHLNTPSTEYQVAENIAPSVMPEFVDVVTLEDDIEPSIQHSSPITENPTELQETTAHFSPLQPANLVPMVPVSVEPLVIPMEFVLQQLPPDAAMPHFAVAVPIGTGPGVERVKIQLIPGDMDPGTLTIPEGGMLMPIIIKALEPQPSSLGVSHIAVQPTTPFTSATNESQDVPVESTNSTPTTGKNTTRQTKQKNVKIDTVRQYVPILPKPLSQQPRQKAAPESQPSVPFQMLVKALKKKWKPASACLPPQNTEPEDGMPTLTPGLEPTTQSHLPPTASGHTFKMSKKSPPKPVEESPCCINPHIKKNMTAVKDLELNGWSRQGPSTSAEPSTSAQPSTSAHDASNNEEQEEAESETEIYDNDIAELERRIPGQKNPRRNALKLRKNQNPRGIVKVQMNRMRHYSALAIQRKQILGAPGYDIADPAAPVVKAPKKEKLPLFQLPRADQRAIRSILSKVINKVSGVKTRNRHRSPQLPARNVYSRRTRSQINQRT